MQGSRLGCLTGTGIIAALITALAIAVTAFTSGGSMFSPGALNAITGPALGGFTSHAEIAGQCGLCHAAPWEADTMDDRCVACHTDIPAELTDIATAHGRMMKISPDATCRECHPEHRGPEGLLTELDGWRYPHEASGYSLNAHQLKASQEKFKCVDCHGLDVTIFDIKVCESCHREMDVVFMSKHITAYGDSCLECHDGLDSLGKSFTHENFSFKLTGAHVAVACELCHANEHSLVELRDTSQDCFDCHKKDDPHGGRLGRDCASCHVTDAWKPANFDHNRSVFKLTGAHATVECAKCHVNDVYEGTPKDCFSCHKADDRHKGQLGTDCGSCHKTTNWTDVTFDHSRSIFPLTGKHVSVECTSCHKNDVFKGTPTNCAACHTDVHLGQLGTTCAQCHTTDGWVPVHFDHNLSAFKLTGAHVQVDCKACHVNGKYKGIAMDCYSCHAAKDVHNGQFGRDCAQCHNPSSWKNVTFDHSSTIFPLTGLHTSVACASCHINGVFKGTPTNCFACHAAKDVHNGQFGSNCGACHNTSGWKNVTFDHNTTAFPLVGSHAPLACHKCHVNGQYKGTPTDCYSCHVAKDAHNGQFGTNCGACHRPTQWKDATFDHNTTAFPLTGRHTGLACQNCHVNGQYQGTPTDCYSCHAAKDAHNGQFGTNCGSCHNTGGWKPASFDHNTTAFPLVGKHTNLECKKCHGGGVFQGTPSKCIACHADKDKHNGANGTDCAICHTPEDWGNVAK